MRHAVRKGKVSVPALVTIGIVVGLAVLVARSPRQPRTDDSATAAAQEDSTVRPDTAPAGSPILPAPAGESEPPVGEFYYLVDISASTKDVGEGTVKRGSATCPCCGFTTPVKSVREQFKKRRGGSAGYQARTCRAANRDGLEPSAKGNGLGLRLALVPLK